MKSKLMLFAFLLFYAGLKAQVIVTDIPPVDAKPAEEDTEYMVYDTSALQGKPEYPGGMDAFYKFVSQTINLPPIEPEEDMKIKIIVTFVIEKDGSISSIKVPRDPGYGMVEEVKRVLRLSKKWKPGEQNGKLVRTSFALPIILQIEGVGKIEEPKVKE